MFQQSIPEAAIYPRGYIDYPEYFQNSSFNVIANDINCKRQGKRPFITARYSYCNTLSPAS